MIFYKPLKTTANVVPMGIETSILFRRDDDLLHKFSAVGSMICEDNESNLSIRKVADKLQSYF